MTVESLKGWHFTRWKVFEDNSEVDWIAFETIPCLVEVEAILSLLSSMNGLKPTYISLACMDGSQLNSKESVLGMKELFEKYRPRNLVGGK